MRKKMKFFNFLRYLIGVQKKSVLNRSASTLRRFGSRIKAVSNMRLPFNAAVLLLMLLSMDTAAGWFGARGFYYGILGVTPSQYCSWHSADLVPSRTSWRIIYINDSNFHCHGYVPYDGEDRCPVGEHWDESIQLCTKTTLQQLAVNQGHSCNNTSNPINIPTGNKYYQEIDYPSSSAAKLTLSRAYNSLSRAWQFSFSQSLALTNETTITVKRASGKSIIFTQQNNQWVAPSQRRERLTTVGESYQLTLTNNTVETYDASGRLLSITPVSRSATQLDYVGNQVTITRLNQTLTLEKDNQDRIVKATLPDNRVITYNYASVNDQAVLTQVTFADQTIRQYHYDDNRYPGFITGITNGLGDRIASVSYDDQGRAMSSEVGSADSGIERTEITYHDDGTRTVKNSLGKEAIYHFTNFNGEYKLTQIEGQPSTHCAAANQAYTYDSNGFMASKTDWNGTTTTYIHNAKGQETSRTEASGTPQARTITTQWHSELNRPVVITEPERVTRFSYDTQGRLLNQVIDTRAP